MSAGSANILPSAPLDGAAGTPAATRRVHLIRWLRRAHGWIGLWGASLGLLFGSTGILLNHRALLRIPAAQAQVSIAQVRLPENGPNDAKAMARWLQHRLALPRPAQRTRQEPARRVVWGDRKLTQPGHWTVMFATPRENVQADWWVGNNYVTVKRSANNFWATLTNLHKGVGMGIGWVLLVDTLAGSIILLSLSGVLLWTQLNRRRLLGTGIGMLSLGLTLALALRSM